VRGIANDFSNGRSGDGRPYFIPQAGPGSRGRIQRDGRCNIP
jgi:hypothetical protein